MPKPYLLGVLNDYFDVENNIDGIIQTSGYKNTHIAKKLNLPLSTYYMKKKSKSFTPKEVFQIVWMLEDDEELENEYLIDLAESRLDEETIPLDEIFKKYNYA